MNLCSLNIKELYKTNIFIEDFMKVTDLRNFFNNKDKKALVDFIISLYKLDTKNREYIESYIDPFNEETIYEKYRKLIEKEFFPVKGDPKLRYSGMRKSINSFKKICRNQELVAKLMLDYVNFGVEFTKEYGDIDENFYIKVTSMYNEALEFIFSKDLDDNFKEFCYSIMNTSDDIGWGVGGIMRDIFFEFYDDI